MAAENHELSQVSSQAPSNFSSTSIEGNRSSAALPDKNVDKTPINADASSPTIKDFSDWSPWEKQLIVFTASTAALFSPLSANIYFPIFNTLANDLHVTDTMINLTVTTYMIFQGLIPTIIGGASDGLGRRPAYILCFIIYTAANIGLALQDQYSALIVLRCLQSAGSSSTVALANAVVADIATASERGTYISYATAGTYIAPAIGPIIGGLLAHYLGWRSVFWFLVIFGATFFVPLLLFFPETCRKIVGDGSIRPAKWNMSILTARHLRRNARARFDAVDTEPSIQKPPFKIPNPFAALIIIFEKEVGLVLASMAMAFGAFYAVTSALPSSYEEIYGFNDIQIALCFIPVGAGSIFAVVTQGRMVDYNYRRYAKRHGISVVKTKQQDLTHFPIERARLEIAIPALLIEALAIIAYGWVTNYGTNLSGPLILLFVIAYSSCASFSIMSILIVDIYPEKAGLATAANNLCRCWLGAGFTAAIIPMINAMGRGWATTLVGLLCLACGPLLIAVIVAGPRWRRERGSRQNEKEARKEERRTAA